MKSLQTTGIVLGRTDYGEADRIIIFLTPDYGKLHLMARGVRKVKSKLAGGIELFSTSDISFLKGKGEIGTLVSSRLHTHYAHIVSDHERLQLGYGLIKLLNKTTEDQPEADYYVLLERAFSALDNTAIQLELIDAWFTSQLLRLGGHTPNLRTDITGENLNKEKNYEFDFASTAFRVESRGRFTARHITALRLLFSRSELSHLGKVQGIGEYLSLIGKLLQQLQAQYISR